MSETTSRDPAAAPPSWRARVGALVRAVGRDPWQYIPLIAMVLSAALLVIITIFTQGALESVVQIVLLIFSVLAGIVFTKQAFAPGNLTGQARSAYRRMGDHRLALANLASLVEDIRAQLAYSTRGDEHVEMGAVDIGLNTLSREIYAEINTVNSALADWQDLAPGHMPVLQEPQRPVPRPEPDREESET